MPSMKLPDRAVYTSRESVYQGKYSTYTEYNYLRPGLISKLKRRRFDIALSLAEPWFGKTGAVDMGCADGIFLPSLAYYFTQAIGVDMNPESCAIARDATSALNNVRVFCDSGSLPTETFTGCGVMFLLEVLEHVGKPATMYSDKVEFIVKMLNVLDAPKVIIASVPRMMGPLFLVKYAIQAATRMHRERLSLAELIRAGIFFDSDAIEPRWQGGHIGFNEYKLAVILRKNFNVRVIKTLTSIFFVISAGD